MRVEWWLDESALPTFLWARLREQEGEPVDVLDCDGRLHEFDSWADAERFLSQDEYVPLAEAVADGRVPAETPVPSGTDYVELVRGMRPPHG